MDDFEKSLRNRLQKSEFKKEWDSLQFEYQIQSELIKARTAAHMTQSELIRLSRRRIEPEQAGWRRQCPTGSASGSPVPAKSPETHRPA